MTTYTPHDERLGGRYVGQSVTRREDAALVTGSACFVDDLAVPQMLHAAFARSEVARGRIVGLDTAAALATDGAVAVLTAADVEPHRRGPMSPTLYLDARGAPLRPLASEDVRFVGEPVAIALGTSRYAAADAAELVRLDVAAEPPVLDAEGAVSSGALVHPELGTDAASSTSIGAPGDTGAADSAAYVVQATFRQQRQSAAPLEPRGVLAWWHPETATLEVWISSQHPREVQLVCGRLLGIPATAVTVRQDAVGGGFGQKYLLGREEQAIILASVALGRPVKWIETRRENLVAGPHARADRVECVATFDGAGRFRSLHVDHLEDVGAYPIGGSGGAGAAVIGRFTGPYVVPEYSATTTAVWTNTSGRGAYRGPWMMETVAREQLMDHAARQLGIDPLELRRRNVVQRRRLPFHWPNGQVVDHVSPAETLEQAATLIGYEQFRVRQRAARRAGHFLGIGLSLYIEPQASIPVLRNEGARLRLALDGSVDVFVGSGAHGQGVATTMAQITADELHVELAAVRVHQGDTSSAPYGNGTGGSRTGPVLGASVRRGAEELRAQIVAATALLLEAAPHDIEVVDGHAGVRGVPDRRLALSDIARRLLVGAALDVDDTPTLDVTVHHRLPAPTYSNACHACTVELDVETGKVTILQYVVSEDCGIRINPQIVEGQVMGGVAQGVAGALYEQIVYDGAGTPMTTGLSDYLVPGATEIPPVVHGHVVTASGQPGGVKGMGEGGAIGAPPCVANAVADAMHPVPPPPSLPYAPAVVWRSLQRP